MSNVLVFTPKHKLHCQRNYDEFIAFAKNDLTLFEDHQFKSPNGKQVGWSCDKWSWETARGKKLTIVFGHSENHSSYKPFKYPFSDFAKAYVRYNQSLNQKDSVMWASSLVWLHNALEEFATHNGSTSVDIMSINNAVINRVEEQITNSKLGAGAKRNIGLSFEKVLNFIKEKRFKLDLQDWSNPFPRLTDTSIKLDKESKQEEEDKCPSDYQMLSVADAFNKAQSTRQKFYSSLCVMLMCQPSRDVELQGLSVNSLQKSENGRLYLMWHPAKGGDPVRKWIPKLLEDVAQQAFDRLVEISAPARAAAKFAYENPNVFMVHDECITPVNFPQNIPLTYDQFAHAMGFTANDCPNKRRIGWSQTANIKWLSKLINEINNVSDWTKDIIKEGSYSVLSTNEIVVTGSLQPTDIQIRFPSYSDLRQVTDRKYKLNERSQFGNVKPWESITLVRENEFHKQFKVKPFSWVHLTHGMLSDAIGSERGNDKTKMQSIFDELDIKDEDGSPLRLNSHQFRHWLNTKLKLAGVDDWLIAKWSGRADLEQNKAYDGRTKEQKSRLTKRLGHANMNAAIVPVALVNKTLSPYTSESPPTPLVLHSLNLPISLRSLGVDKDGVAQFTGLGFCVHNYAESPCIKSGDCTVCSEHVCLKGMPNTLDEMKGLECLYAEQLMHAKASATDNVFGADRWVTSIGFRLSKIRTIISMLEDPKKSDGAQVRIPDELDPSPVKRSLNIDEKDVIPSVDLMSLALSDLDE